MLYVQEYHTFIIIHSMQPEQSTGDALRKLHKAAHSAHLRVTVDSTRAHTICNMQVFEVQNRLARQQVHLTQPYNELT